MATTMEIKWEAMVVNTDGRGKWQNATVPYIVKGLVIPEGDHAEEALIDYVQDNAPNKLQGLPMQSISIEEMFTLTDWSVNVSYGFTATSSTSDSTTRAEVEQRAGETCETVSADVGSETLNMISSIATVDSALSDQAQQEGITLKQRRLINEQDDGTALGVDVYSPEMDYTETHTFDNSKMDADYMNGLLLNGCTVNSVAFRGFEPGEVLFHGASINRDDSDWKVTFRFKIKKNNAAVALPGFSTTFAKKGWDYLWVYAKEVKTTTGEEINISSYPIARYTEQVYEASDFGFLGIDL